MTRQRKWQLQKIARGLCGTCGIGKIKSSERCLRCLRKLRPRSKKYYYEHRDECLASSKKWREDHPFRYKELQDRYRAKNKAKLAKLARERYTEKKERLNNESQAGEEVSF